MEYVITKLLWQINISISVVYESITSYFIKIRGVTCNIFIEAVLALRKIIISVRGIDAERCNGPNTDDATRKEAIKTEKLNKLLGDIVLHRLYLMVSNIR